MGLAYLLKRDFSDAPQPGKAGLCAIGGGLGMHPSVAPGTDIRYGSTVSQKADT